VTTKELLEKLISFDTVSRNSNMQLMGFVKDWLLDQGIVSQLIPNPDGSKANLYATVGDNVANTDLTGGVMLSGHTDVVPVDGQDWTLPAFKLTQQHGKYFGRGTADMKGFVACALTAMSKAKARPLQAPLHLALSYDEEIGCVGVRSLIEQLSHQQTQPRLCIVGEPTEMSVAIRHKGKIGIRATFTGRSGHSALAPQALNAIYLATDFLNHLREVQNSLAAPHRDGDHSKVPYTTLHAGIIKGGTALNIVPDTCTVDFEIRNSCDDDPQSILSNIIKKTEDMVSLCKDRIPEASVRFDVLNEYPGLETANGCTEVAFGTEAGLFSSVLAIPSVVCGPGSMAQGHKPDEFIAIEQMEQCEAMLDRLLTRMCQSSPGTP